MAEKLYFTVVTKNYSEERGPFTSMKVVRVRCLGLVTTLLMRQRTPIEVIIFSFKKAKKYRVAILDLQTGQIIKDKE